MPTPKPLVQQDEFNIRKFLYDEATAQRVIDLLKAIPGIIANSGDLQTTLALGNTTTLSAIFDAGGASNTTITDSSVVIQIVAGGSTQLLSTGLLTGDVTGNQATVNSNGSIVSTDGAGTGGLVTITPATGMTLDNTAHDMAVGINQLAPTHSLEVLGTFFVENTAGGARIEFGGEVLSITGSTPNLIQLSGLDGSGIFNNAAGTDSVWVQPNLITVTSGTETINIGTGTIYIEDGVNGSSEINADGTAKFFNGTDKIEIDPIAKTVAISAAAGTTTIGENLINIIGGGNQLNITPTSIDDAAGGTGIDFSGTTGNIRFSSTGMFIGTTVFTQGSLTTDTNISLAVASGKALTLSTSINSDLNISIDGTGIINMNGAATYTGTMAGAAALNILNGLVMA